MNRLISLSLIFFIILLSSGCHKGKKAEEELDMSGLTLEGIEEGKVESQKPKAKSQKPMYHCPMHPTYVSDRPGECPICGMDLVLIEEEEVEGMEGIEGLATVKITPERQQLIGVRTGTVEYKPLKKVIRTVGKVDYDERRLAYVNTKVGGWIEKLFVDYTGQLVKKGQPLLSIYSPELVSTQQEYLLALKAKKYLEDSPFKEIASGGDSLLRSTKRRLLLWDITERQIRELERSGKPRKTMTINSPIDGFVVHKTALEGKYANPGENLYRIANLSTVWVYADIYEYEIPLIEVGQEATVTFSYYPGEAFTGRVIYIYPYLEKKTRTVKVRIEFNNPGFRLKPEMYANVELSIDLGERLAIPESAVLDSGKRQIVFVDRGEGYFQPREVKLGQKVENYYVVLDGLSAGERVVTSANFLIDSESKLRSAIEALGKMEHQH